MRKNFVRISDVSKYQKQGLSQKEIAEKLGVAELSESDLQIKEYLELGLTQKEISEKMGLHLTKVNQRVLWIENVLGIKFPRKPARIKRTELDEIDKSILERIPEGKTQLEIAEEFGVSQSNISVRIKEMKKKGIEVPDSQVENNKKLKNTEINNEILSQIIAGKTVDEISNGLSMSTQSIFTRIRKMRKEGIEVPYAGAKGTSSKLRRQEYYLTGAEKTQQGINVKKLASCINATNTEDIINQILYIMTQKIPLNPNSKSADKFQRTAEQIIADKNRNGYCDSSTLFVALCREKGIPAAQVITANFSELMRGNYNVGHFFSCVYIKEKDKWFFLDPNKEIKDLSKGAKLYSFSFKSEFLDRNHYRVACVRDYSEYEKNGHKIDSIKSMNEIHKMVYNEYMEKEDNIR